MTALVCWNGVQWRLNERIYLARKESRESKRIVARAIGRAGTSARPAGQSIRLTGKGEQQRKGHRCDCTGNWRKR